MGSNKSYNSVLIRRFYLSKGRDAHEPIEGDWDYSEGEGRNKDIYRSKLRQPVLWMNRVRQLFLLIRKTRGKNTCQFV